MTRTTRSRRRRTRGCGRGRFTPRRGRRMPCSGSWAKAATATTPRRCGPGCRTCWGCPRRSRRLGTRRIRRQRDLAEGHVWEPVQAPGVVAHVDEDVAEGDGAVGVRHAGDGGAVQRECGFGLGPGDLEVVPTLRVPLEWKT